MSRGPLSALILSLSLGGCVLMPVEVDKLDGQVDAWLEQKQYDDALTALTRVDPKHPQYPHLAERRKEVESLARKYEQQVLRDGKRLSDKGDWAAALDLYDEALDRLPDSTLLRDGLSELHSRQLALVAERRLTLLLHEGRWIDASLKVLEDIHNIIPRDSKAASDLKKMESRGIDVGEELATIGLKALDEGDYRTAGETLPLATRLSSGEQARAGMKAYEAYQERRRRESQKVEAERQRQKEEEERRYNKLAESYQLHFKGKRFAQARVILEEMRKERPKEPELDSMKRRLENAIVLRVEEQFKAGTEAYGKSQFEKAQRAWSEVLRLDPEHAKARENLERVEKVLENLRLLRERQGG